VNKNIILGKIRHDEFVGLCRYEFKDGLAISIAVLVFLLLLFSSVVKGMPIVGGSLLTIMQINFCSFVGILKLSLQLTVFLRYHNFFGHLI
jgi:hypothetical protein